jgi:hypothetical protein
MYAITCIDKRNLFILRYLFLIYFETLAHASMEAKNPTVCYLQT